ncbi:MAG: hypothetical protein IT245_05800 [Bacteroidia bacterium]|nr:hypothetical protein [Bacteroidia bacterium]
MKKLLIFGLIALSIYACKKGTDVTPESNKPTEDLPMKYLTAAPWLAYKVTLSGVNIWDLGMIDGCMKDDSYRFYKDSTLTQYENTNVCSGSPDSTESEWYFFKGREKMVASILGLTDTANIISLDTANMQLQIDYDGSPVMVYFKKK